MPNRAASEPRASEDDQEEDVRPGRRLVGVRRNDERHDDERRAESALQKQTDDSIAEIDSLLKGKEEEILAV